MQNSNCDSIEHLLLFAKLGQEHGFITKVHVVGFFTHWVMDKSISIGDYCVSNGFIKFDQKSIIDLAIAVLVANEGSDLTALASNQTSSNLNINLGHLDDTQINECIKSINYLKLKSDLKLNHKAEYQIKNKLTNENTLNERFDRLFYLDSGALGEVWIANDLELNRKVAIKYLKKQLSEDLFQKSFFHLEGEVTGFLEHPNIAPVYGLGIDSEKRYYYAMRFIKGQNLGTLIAQYHALGSGWFHRNKNVFITVLQHFQSACMAIEYAHSKGVIHCDIKPANIMIGLFGEVMVVDWGLVLINKFDENINEEFTIGKENDNQSSHKPHLYRPSPLATPGLHCSQGGLRDYVGGTPAYMAPEQMEATRGGHIGNVTFSSDIFSLGATLYHLLTNKAPQLPDKQNNEKVNNYYKRIANGIFPKPRSINKEIPKSLEGIVIKSMAMEPNNRYHSARELSEDIKRWISDESVIGYHESTIEKILRWKRKNVALVGFLLVFLVCGLIVGIWFSYIVIKHNDELVISENLARVNFNEAEAAKEIAVSASILSAKNEVTAKENELRAFENEKKVMKGKLVIKNRESLAISAISEIASSINLNDGLKGNLKLNLIRKDLLKGPIEFYKKLSVQLKNNIEDSNESLAELAKVQVELGLLVSDYGDHIDAISILEEAALSYDAICKAKIIDLSNISLYADCKNYLGKLYFAKQDFKAALKAFEISRSLRNDLVNSNPISCNLHDLAAVINNIAVVQINQKDFMLAENTFLHAISIWEQSIKIDTTTGTKQKLGIGSAYNNIGIKNEKEGKFDKAYELYEKSILMMEELILKDNDVVLKSDIVDSITNLANLQIRQGLYVKGRENLDKAMNIGENLYHTNPSIAKYRIQVVRLLEVYGELFKLTGKLKICNDIQAIAQSMKNEIDIVAIRKLSDQFWNIVKADRPPAPTPTDRPPAPTPTVRPPAPTTYGRQVPITKSPRESTPPFSRPPAPASTVRPPGPTSLARPPGPTSPARPPAPTSTVRPPAPTSTVRPPAPTPN